MFLLSVACSATYYSVVTDITISCSLGSQYEPVSSIVNPMFMGMGMVYGYPVLYSKLSCFNENYVIIGIQGQLHW
jgi:hypothetical protein